MPTSLAEHLVARGVLSRDQARAALEVRATVGGSLDTALLELGNISEIRLLEALAEVSGYPSMNLAELGVDRGIAPLIPPKIADRFGIVPLTLEGDALRVACSYPVPNSALREIGFLLSKNLELSVALEVRIRAWIRDLYGVRVADRFAPLLASLEAAHASDSLSHSTERQPEAIFQGADLVDQLSRAIIAEPIAMEAPNGFQLRGESDSRWGLTEARAALKEAAGDRDRVIDVTLTFARRAFDFAGVFAVVGGSAISWALRGEGLNGHGARASIPLDAASVFRTVAMTRGSYVGSVPPDALNAEVFRQLGRSPRTVFLFPVEVGSRLVAILYGDCEQRPMSRRRLSEFILFCQDLPAAFQQLIQLRRRGKYSIPDSSTAGGSPEFAPDPSSAAVWTPAGPADPPASLPPSRRKQQPPADFEMLLGRLTGPNPEQRSRAMDQLEQFPEESATQLAIHFPGPTAWSRVPVFDLPEAAELGPIPAAMARLGEAGARALAPLLDSPRSNTRYFALLTAGSLPSPALVDGVLRALFDLVPDISSAARAAATSLRCLPRFERSLKSIRQELASRDSLRRCLAARALGVLHDRHSVDGLIGLTSSDDPLCAQAAAEALREITKAAFGTSQRNWSMWWAENRERSRTEWLVAALRHKDLDLRLSAIQELAKAFNDGLGYFAYGPASERESAVKRWEALIRDVSRRDKLEG